VSCAFLELEQPDLAAAVQQAVTQGIGEITVVPMFLGTGKHAREDLPRMVDALRVRCPDVRITLRQPVGEDPRVLDLLAAIAGE
jgi:sirohydrochlorin cobaltochelatase